MSGKSDTVEDGEVSYVIKKGTILAMGILFVLILLAALLLGMNIGKKKSEKETNKHKEFFLNIGLPYSFLEELEEGYTSLGVTTDDKSFPVIGRVTRATNLNHVEKNVYYYQLKKDVLFLVYDQGGEKLRKLMFYRVRHKTSYNPRVHIIRKSSLLKTVTTQQEVAELFFENGVSFDALENTVYDFCKQAKKLGMKFGGENDKKAKS